MYRKMSDVLKALQEGKTTVKSCRNQLSYYRKNEDVDTSLMFLTAIEIYRVYKISKGTPLKYLDS